MRVSSTRRAPARAGAAALLLAGAGLAAGAAADPGALLADMAESMRESAYEGTLVYQHGENIDTMSLVHGMLDGREHERLRTLTGEPFELIREGESVTCVWPKERVALESQRPGGISPLRSLTELTELPRMYSAHALGRERMTGRAADVIEIRPRDDMRYGYRMWIDPQSHLLLRSDLLASDGTTLERILFTELRRVDDVSPADFKPSLDVEYASHGGNPDAARGEALSDPEWSATDLPAGFSAVSHLRRSMPPDGHPVQQSVFSDGLASVSVFVEPAGGKSLALKGVSRMGAVHVYGLRTEGYRITAVGDVPGRTVRAIAESMRRDAEG